MAMLPTHALRNVVAITGGSKTLAVTDAGTVQNCVPTTAGTTTTITLPVVAAGNLGVSFTIRAGSNSGDSPVTITPGAGDFVNGLGFTAAANKGPQVLAAVQKGGDEITLRSTGSAGAVGWVVDNAVGTWTRLP